MVRNCECYAVINEQDPRAEWWKQIVGSKLQVPLKHPMPVTMSGPHGIHKFYEGDPSRLDKKQWDQLADIIVNKFEVTHAQVIKDLEDGYLPIKMEGCVVSICQMHMLCML